ncbi:tRNA uridine-5-carboxymethylaminomethyl(34) synthesis enzyme MnmG [Babesia caballi]|uniref:tRNA uridine-5-carboxymethylaminomethyl(34) synthesis enzyme MnmG n=1 Tax=Babesia caballi TaxID=5871 RepID=A0AAV4LZ08_BABCB|nr:tRNA uridine-5-carboxymethylaminomethyl(34) synthesis enzyme MnmG [Babesia caballi]
MPMRWQQPGGFVKYIMRLGTYGALQVGDAVAIGDEAFQAAGVGDSQPDQQGKARGHVHVVQRVAHLGGAGEQDALDLGALNAHRADAKQGLSQLLARDAPRVHAQDRVPAESCAGLLMKNGTNRGETACCGKSRGRGFAV